MPAFIRVICATSNELSCTGPNNTYFFSLSGVLNSPRLAQLFRIIMSQVIESLLYSTGNNLDDDSAKCFAEALKVCK